MTDHAWTAEERRVLRSLRTPGRIQDFLNELPQNHEPDGDTCFSPRLVLRHGRAHCVEGAMLAAVALRLVGERPFLLDLTTSDDDQDHVVALFRRNAHWGAISKTNHAVLRYREPVYRTVRELAMSYFHEYFLQSNGKKTLRSYAGPVDLTRFDRRNWMTSEEEVWYVPEYLCAVSHKPVLTRGQIASLRAADWVERRAGEIVEWEDGRKTC
ncbi:hypothetical protein A2348_03885 [Candidatus Uhrbacteria bacterium RIFOXYB12_FULL_58_10]|uniref:Transglutaminase-like domain-containing protein n=1 Tax=Candidatus Uhrbacteria bacterium RIFOXYB2_FULL_57_15 TaxID=1802422 RepID=A0A1F7W8G6_9BACT|nr:MAG: hypothetical protein A2348_03885 [Candidatus Uhrbacteria bacterium RIFOXYB12_FULL_58_10]OGL99105.1 MAG: hypothetical protein A2304_04550 [Candidatus Uhrbacteria bacterium RIFOXYB2_FULL_57_15]OGL99596.1 MAG: hypothetical protein A2501_00090 [Candidatus Uhrbacteria bacterium RIFOXYC12_FULL_57_11]